MTSFADYALFLYTVFCTAVVSSQIIYFAAKGIQRHLADHKQVRDMRQMDETLRKIER